MTDFVYLDMRRYRKAFVVASRQISGSKIDTVVTVECPLCPQRHTHGGTVGHRGGCGIKVAHCQDRSADVTGAAWAAYVVWDDRPLEAWEL